MSNFIAVNIHICCVAVAVAIQSVWDIAEKHARYGANTLKSYMPFDRYGEKRCTRTHVEKTETHKKKPKTHTHIHSRNEPVHFVVLKM